MKTKKPIAILSLVVFGIVLLLTIYYVTLLRPQLIPTKERTTIVEPYNGEAVNYLQATEPDKKDATFGEGTYELGKNQLGEIVFKYPDKAMDKIQKDCKEYLESLNEGYGTSVSLKNSWRTKRITSDTCTGNNEIEAAQREMLRKFLEYYENMYEPKVRDPYMNIKYFPDFTFEGFGSFLFYHAI